MFRYIERGGYPVATHTAITFDLNQPVEGWEWEYTKSYGTDTQRRITRTVDALGRKTTYGLNPVSGDKTKVTYPDETEMHSQFNAFSQITYSRDSLGRVKTFTYDAFGNKLTETVGQVDSDEDGIPETVVGLTATRSWTYTSQGQIETATDFNGNVTEYFYSSGGSPSSIDGLGYLVKVVEPADIVGGPRAETLMSYDGSGRQISTTDPEGRTTSQTYDLRNRLLATTYNDGSTESYIYGYGMDQNLLVGKTDRNGNLTTFDFDDHGRLIETVIAANNPTIASLEACTWLPGTTLKETCTIDGDVTHYSYDWHLRPVGETKFPSNGSALSNLRKYDNARRLVVKTDLYGRSSFDVYDALDYRIRTVQELVPGSITSLLGLSSGDVPSQTELTTIVRDLNANAAYIVIDIVYNADRQVIAQVDGRGLVDLYEYDGRARRIVSLKNGAQIAAGATLDDIQNQVWTAITDPTVAQRTEIIYDEQSNISAMKHPRYFDSNDSQGYLKDQVTRTYTGRNLLASQTEAPGTLDAATEYFSYFLDKRAKGRTDGRGNVWSQLWHICCGRIQASLDPAGHGTITNTDFFGNVTHTAVVANLPNDVTAYDWHDPIDADTISEVTTKYDARNRQIAQTQWLTPLGFVNDHARPDLNGEDLPIADRLVAPLDPANFGDLRPATDGLTTTWAYDDNLTDGQDIDADPAYAAAIALANLGGNSAGSAALITNPAGETTLLVKDGLGRTVITVDPEEDIQQTVFDVLTPGLPGSAGELLTTTRIIDPAGLALTSSQHVDGGGRLLVTTDAEGFQTIMSYDANSNRISIRDANGVGDDCVFDIADREITCTDTQGDTTTRIFDAKDHIVVNTDAFGQSEIYVFDARGRKTVCTDRIGAVTEYAYDANNNVITITDAEGGLTRYLYDVRNLLVREEFPTHQAGTNPGDVGNDARWYAYDAGQRLTRRVDQQGDITRYRYDLANRLRARRYPDGAHDRFGYDAASRLIRARSNRYDVTVRRDYFSDSMLRREVMVIDGDQHVIKHRYDKANRLRRTTYPTGAVVARRWTDRSLNRAIRYEGDLIARFAHDAGRRETSRRYGNGIVTARTYRNDNLLESISAPGVAGFHYGYDANKRKTSVTDTELTAWSQTFAYDAEDRLVDWTRTGGDSSGQLAAQTWDLSLVGDWNNTARDGVVETRTHNAVHEITSTQVGANPTQAVIHDDKGNLIANPNRHATYQWDFDNRLSQAENTVDDLTHTYRYDALGRRVQKTATNADASTTTTTYVLAGSQVLTELQDGLASVSYVYGAYVDEPLAQIDHVTGEKHFYHADHRYSVAALTDESGQVCHRYAYDAYGNRSDFDAAGQPVIVSDADDKFHAYGHTGRRHDSETGLQYFRARYFDGKLGRFAGRDPLKYIDGMSMYLAYFVPAKMDPTGESTVHQWHLRCNKIPNKRERCKCHCVYSPPDYGKGSCCVTNCMKTPGRIGGLSKSTLLFAFPFFLFLVFYLRGRSNVQVLREA
jgi:RHS repeat-associated protein